jgi:hypothetical protein
MIFVVRRTGVVVGLVTLLGALASMLVLVPVPTAGALGPGGINLGAAGASVPVAPPAGSPLRNIDRDAGISVRLSDGKALWMFADTTLHLGSAVVWFSGRGTGAIASTNDLASLREPTVPYGYLQVPATGLIDGGDVSCPEGYTDYYWPTSAVAIPLGGGRDRVLLYYVAVCGISPDLTTYRAQTMGIAEYVYDANNPPSPSNPIVATVKNPALFPPMPGHTGAGVGYGAASFVRNGEIYTYGCHYSPSFQQCRVAKTTPGAALSSDGYTYWDGNGWNGDASDAVDLDLPLSLVGIKGSAAWVPGLNKYVFVDNDYPNAQLAIRFADRPQGPWTAPTFVALPDCVGHECRAGELHAETSDASSLLLSYYVTGMLPALRVLRVPIVANPIGAVDAVRPATPTTINVNGWALDPDTTAPIPVAVYLDGAGIGWFTADGERPDIAAAFPGYGSSHGFDITVAAPPGTHEVCVYGINSGTGSGNPLLSCRRTTLLSGNPVGVVDRAQPASPTSINVAGWTLDPDTAAAATIAVYLDGALASTAPAAGGRDDIAAAFPGYGPGHGFDVTVPSGPGNHQVCVWVFNSGAGSANVNLSCSTVHLTSGNPIGVVDAVRPANPTTINVAGWALDPDRAESVPVALYLDGVGVGWFPADGHRPDIAAAFPGYGAAHGFSIDVPAGPGTHELCLYAINAGAGTGNPLLSCVTTTLASGNPSGVLDRAQFVGPSSINLVGWAFDPDTAAPIPVAVYVDTVGIGWFMADRNRPDLAVALPGHGPMHAFNITVTATPGPHQVCLYAINVGGGSGNPLLRCASVSYP